jgi:hypothetical protein
MTFAPARRRGRNAHGSPPAGGMSLLDLARRREGRHKPR